MYQEVFRADARVRTHPARSAAAAAFDEVKGRLDRWLAALEDQDPYRLLGVSPADSPERVREAYRDAARANHPDRGGSVERMRQVNEAYERIASHRERRQAELESGPVALESGL
jgi:DnaJ-domain-containing protein 1